MKSNHVAYFANSFIWGAISKLLNAGLKFLTIPLLLNYFGKDMYGLLTLAIAINGYILLLDMGMNTGAVKFFSQWIAAGKYDLINRVARTNLSFYLIIGLTNSIILIVLAITGKSIFNVTADQFKSLQSMLFVLAGFTIIDWSTFVFIQLLVADEKIAFTQQILTALSILNLILVLLTITFKLSIIQFFAFNLFLNISIIIPYSYLCRKRKLILSFIPAFYWKDFAIILKYSLAIFAMSLFQYTATQSRPLVLGMFSDKGVGILSDYRVIEVFPIFIISIGGMLISILLPKTSKAIQNNNRPLIEKMAYEGTKYTSILVAALCFPIILNSGDLLTLYVGQTYSYLWIWLSLWVFTLVLFLHNSPIASLVLATGKTRMLVYSSAVACIVSIIVNAILCKYYDVGSAVIGYLSYVLIQISFYYFYFNNVVLGLKSFKVFKSFIIPTAIGFFLMVVIHFVNINMNSLIIKIAVKSLLWAFGYLILLIIFRIIDIKELFTILGKKA